MYFLHALVARNVSQKSKTTGKQHDIGGYGDLHLLVLSSIGCLIVKNEEIISFVRYLTNIHQYEQI